MLIELLTLLCLIWKTQLIMTTHADAVHQRIASFHCKTKFADCVFVVGKNHKEYSAIKALLAIQSEYFEKMLFNQYFNTSKHSTIQPHQNAPFAMQN